MKLFLKFADNRRAGSPGGMGEFDAAHSNSVIELLFSLESPRKMAGEILRVGLQYFIQTRHSCVWNSCPL